MFWRRTIASRDRAESGEPPREDDRIRGFIELDALPIWRAVKPEVLRPVAVRGLRAFEYRRMPSAEGWSSSARKLERHLLQELQIPSFPSALLCVMSH